MLGDKITDRVISVGSALYVLGRIRLDDLNWERRKYSMFAAYAQSKLAAMLFTAELARRGVRAYISDPGMAHTDITRDSSGVLHWLGEHLLEHLGQSATDGARATIAALTTDQPSGTYLAPRFNQWGKPTLTMPANKARDPETSRRLWELSAELTGCDWVGRLA